MPTNDLHASVITRKTILSEGRDILLLILVSMAITFSGLWCKSCRDDTQLLLMVWSLTSLMWILLWKGNAFLAQYISAKISWIRFPLKRVVVGFFAATLYTLAVVYLIGFIFGKYFSGGFSGTIVTTLIITLAISLFMHGRSFLLNWRMTAVEAEKFQKESIAAKYESLKNQVNPHFLFNSLNALTNLIYEDKDKASQFIDQLAEIYRYVLETRDREVVGVNEELAFIRSYLFLQKIRFGDKLDVSFPNESTSGYIAPLALQMLIENAIKHNVVSEENPLKIRISIQDAMVVVTNNFQLKMRYDEPSSGVGLQNICSRYQILTPRKVEIIQDTVSFVVKIPLLNEVEIEHTNLN